MFWKFTHHNRLFASKYNTWREDVTSSFHDSSHLGRDKVYNRLVGYLYWLHIFEDIKVTFPAVTTLKTIRYRTNFQDENFTGMILLRDVCR